MEKFTYYTQGNTVAFRYNHSNHTVLKAVSHPGAASFGQTDWGSMPLWDRAEVTDYEAIKAATLQELGLIDAHSMYDEQIAAYEAEQEGKHLLFA